MGRKVKNEITKPLKNAKKESRQKPQKKSAHLWEVLRPLVLVAICVALAAAICFLIRLSNVNLWVKAGRYVQWTLGVAAVLAICQMAFKIHKNFDQLENNKDFLLGVITATATGLVGITFWLPQLWGFSLPNISGRDLFGYYTAQLSLTFISISVMSVLSDRSVVIYWENVAQRKLIKPVFGSFASYTYYSIGTTVGSGISVLLGKGIAFYVFFGINVLVLILLTLTMVDVYYGREKKKAALQEQLKLESCAYENWNKKTDSEKSAAKDSDAATREQTRAEAYEKNMVLLQQNIYRAREEHDLVFLQEVLNLYVNYRHCFSGINGKRVCRLIMQEHNIETWLLLLKEIKVVQEEMKQDVERASTDVVDCTADEWIWTAVAHSRFLREWLQGFGSGYEYQRELWEFMQLVLRRFVDLYNQCVLDYNAKNTMNDKKLSVLHVKEEDQGIKVEDTNGQRLEYETCWDLMKDYLGRLTTESFFLSTLVEIVAIMLEELGGYYRTCLVSYYNDLPVFRVITKRFHMLNLEQYRETWEKSFPAKK